MLKSDDVSDWRDRLIDLLLHFRSDESSVARHNRTSLNARFTLLYTLYTMREFRFHSSDRADLLAITPSTVLHVEHFELTGTPLVSLL